jgi:hypothetical protein
LVNELSLLLVKQFGNYDGVTMKPDEYEEKTFHLSRKFGSNLRQPSPATAPPAVRGKIASMPKSEDN